MRRIPYIFANVTGLILKLTQKRKGNTLISEEEFIGYEVFPSEYQAKTYQLNRVAVGFIREDNKQSNQ